MNNILKYTLVGTSLLIAASCSLDKDPISDFSENTIAGGSSSDSIKYATKAEMQTQYEGMYNGIKGAQEFWFVDMLVINETHADNAYCGTGSAELTTLEQNTQDGVNKNLERDWNGYFNQINAANRVICNVDKVPDQSLTAAERKQWKAEAQILRAWMLFDMVRIWGPVPVVTEETPDITSDNIEEIYPLLFPPRQSIDSVYSRIIKDLEAAIEVGGAPAVNSSNKFLLSRGVAHALLAKVYAEEPVRDYQKVIDYCIATESDGFSLMPKYTDLFSVKMDGNNEKAIAMNNPNSAETIFSMNYISGDNWASWMFGMDLGDPTSNYSWAKWITPSRDLIAAFEEEGDEIRKNEAIVWRTCTWSNHYPADHYPFMYKLRSKFNSVIKLRLADILLLKAEAYVEQNKLPEAAALVKQIRDRVQLPDLASDVKGSKEKMRDAVLKERRLELAFEGQRWFDLVRTGKVYTVLNTLNSRDAGRMPMSPITIETLIMPIPQTQIDKNPSLTQNPGY